MFEESEPRREKGCLDPTMSRHRPASEITQDNSHILASIFKDLYTTDIIGKETVANLTKTKSGGNSFHDKYVERLQQVHSEYSLQMHEADMLENHIVMARVQTMANEIKAHSRVGEELGQAYHQLGEELGQAYHQLGEELGQAYHQLGLPPGRSTFMCSVDYSLLKSNNLICPEDYITHPTPLVRAPQVRSTPGFAKPTMSYNRRRCDFPLDDGDTLIPPQGKTAQSLMEASEISLTITCSSDSGTPLSTHSQRSCQLQKPKWRDELNAKSRAEVTDGLHKLQQRHNFLRNPRFLPPKAQQGARSLILPEEDGARRGVSAKRSPAKPVPVFLANPSVVYFTDYVAGQVYETTVELRNTSPSSRQIRVLPPTTPHFSLGLGRFPGEGGVVAPGMACQYTVRFVPDSLTNYQDLLVVETQDQFSLLVPIEASRPPPVLTLPSVLDCGYCLLGGVKVLEFLCRNDGLSAGTFCIIPRRQWPASNIRSVVNNSFAEEAPFGISPSLFGLQAGQTTVLEVVFLPTTTESWSQVFTIVCDNCQVKDITLQGQGQLIGLEMVYVSGGEDDPVLDELRDLTADHYVCFPPTNPHSVQQKTITIRNNTHLELEFHWQILQPNLKPLLPGKSPDSAHIQYHLANDDVFHINPTSGLLAPLGDNEFLLTFTPKELMDYRSVCHLVIRDVPELPKATSEDHGAPLGPGPKVMDVVVMEIGVRGRTEAYQVLLEPYSVHIPGEVLTSTTIRRRFKMWNNSRSSITFQWERITDCHIMEVEPPAGIIEMNECLDLELVLTGGRPGAVESSLTCHIQHHSPPVVLLVRVTFKGPHVSVNVARVDLGLVRLGDQSQASVVLTNNTPLEAPWSLTHGKGPHSHTTEITVDPCRGVLPPLASSSVDILFKPQACQHFTTILELSVENGQGCHLSVDADILSPQVCLLSCELVFLELFVGVPAQATITLFNQSPLPAQYTWTKLQGEQTSLCSARFTPSCGTLGANNKMDVTVTFTSHTDIELRGVAALCEVTGMEKPLVLEFHSKAKRLNVSYSLPINRPVSDEQGSDTSLVLDFGDKVLLKQPITKQLVITNHTAICAPFTLKADYFTGQAPSPPVGQSQHRGVYMRKPLHSVQAKTIEDRAHEGFVNSLLADGRGAAFLIQPDCGILGAFESQTVDITAFTNMWGDYRDQLICKIGDLTPKLIPMQMKVRGCPIYFQMIGPQPDNQNQGPIIRFGCHVSGGDTVSRSLRLNNSSPHDIRMDWENFTVDQHDRKLLDLVVSYGNAFPLKANGNEVVGGTLYARTFPTWSHTPSTIGTSSSPRSKSDSGEDQLVTDEEEGALYSTPPQRKLVSVSVRPHEGNPSDYPYCITPQQIVVPAGGSSTIQPSFTPLLLSGLTSNSTCVAFALGFMSLDSGVASCIPGKVTRAQGLELEPLRLDFQASVRPAVLTVQMEEEGGTLEFYTVASDLIHGNPHSKMAQKEFVMTRTFQLKNNTAMHLSFRLSATPPFSVLQPQPGGPSRTPSSASTPGDHQLLVLESQHIMQVKVAFHCSPSLLAYLRQPVELLPPSVSLVTNGSGERKLTFQQTVSVEYSNNSFQYVPLEAHLTLPTLHLSCDHLDFGTCYVGQTRVREVHLYNQGGSASYWKASIGSDGEEDPGAFRVTPDCGVLHPLEQSVPSCRESMQISFTASQEGGFRARVRFLGVLGEPPLLLHIQGSGSFDESYVSLLSDT